MTNDTASSGLGHPEEKEPLHEVASESGESKVTIVDVLDDDEAVGHAMVDLDDEEWHTSHVSLEKLQIALDAASKREDATHVRFYVNENGVVVFERGWRDGVVLMPMTDRDTIVENLEDGDRDD